MSEMVERVAKAILGASGYSSADIEKHWPDELDSLVSGPPFEADGYREMARAAVETMRGVPDVCYENYVCDKLWRELTSKEVWYLWLNAALAGNAARARDKASKVA